MELQELVARARILFQSAPKRVLVFSLVNGKKSAKEIAKKSGKSLSATLQDLQKMRDLELIDLKKNDEGKLVKKDNSSIYEKVPLLKHLSSSYFESPEKIAKTKSKQKSSKSKTNASITILSVPSEQQILQICTSGEDQLYEFKSTGTAMEKISKEICAFANTKFGGIIFYGVEDDGAIENSNLNRQKFDQSIQNSVRHNITPTPFIKVIEKSILGYNIILIIISPWNRKEVHHFQDNIYIRRGTNVFKTKTDESKKLHAGEYIV